ncbi:substrate-binding domain-containing protein [Nocardia sp. NPDC058658]|uniref:substrate-binding domain-containing protein n=1 Tax=Nocardia sp. NPDC058658 TaxID=3346580 RepID=UPI00364F4B7B
MSDFPIDIALSVIGILVTLVAFLREFVFVGRKRLGYRVQMNTPVSRIPLTVSNGADVTVVLIRIENNGSTEIDEGDYRDANRPRLIFPGHSVQATEVTERVTRSGERWALDQLSSELRAIAHSTSPQGVGEIVLPKEILQRGEHYKVLAVLQAQGAAAPITDDREIVKHRGILKSGTIGMTTSRSRREPVLLGLSSFLAVVLAVQLVLAVLRPEPPPDYCASGELRLVGSTAMETTVRKVAESFQKSCSGAKFAFDFTGTTDGLEYLARPEAAPNTVAIGEGPKHETFPDLSEDAFAVAPYSVVVHPDLAVSDLTTEQIQRLFRGQISNWREVGGPDLPVVVVDRIYGSGSRFALEHRLLNWNRPLYQPEPCAGRPRLVHCEVRTTSAMADVVAKNPGAVGYLESAAVRGAAVKAVRIDGVEATMDNVGAKAYPFYSVEFAFNDYPGGQLPAESLAAKFIDYLTHGQGRLIVAEFGAIACVDWDVRADCTP